MRSRPRTPLVLVAAGLVGPAFGACATSSESTGLTGQAPTNLAEDVQGTAARTSASPASSSKRTAAAAPSAARSKNERSAAATHEPVTANIDDGALRVGQRAPKFLLPLLNAATQGRRSFKLHDHVGPEATRPARSVVLNFAASYCEPCKEELSEFKARAPDFRYAEVELAVVVIDTTPEGVEAMRRLTVSDLKLPFPILSDRLAIVARRYGLAQDGETLPTSVVIDGQGVIRWIQTGYEPGAVDRLLVKAGGRRALERVRASRVRKW